MIKGIDHFGVVTTDVERAAKFYTEVLGFRETMRLETEHSGTIVFVGADGVQVELFGGGDPRKMQEGKPVGYVHLALVVDDVDAEHERMSKLGVEFGMKPTSVEAGLRIAFFTDPDGNPIELLQRPG